MSGGYASTGEKRKTVTNKRDSVGMHILSRNAANKKNNSRMTSDVYDGTLVDDDDMVGTKIRPGSSRGSDQKEGDRIQVVTVVQQASTPVTGEGPRHGGEDSESTRKLVL